MMNEVVGTPNRNKSDHARPIESHHLPFTIGLSVEIKKRMR